MSALIYVLKPFSEEVSTMCPVIFSRFNTFNKNAIEEYSIDDEESLHFITLILNRFFPFVLKLFFRNTTLLECF